MIHSTAGHVWGRRAGHGMPLYGMILKFGIALMRKDSKIGNFPIFPTIFLLI